MWEGFFLFLYSSLLSSPSPTLVLLTDAIVKYMHFLHGPRVVLVKGAKMSCYKCEHVSIKLHQSYLMDMNALAGISNLSPFRTNLYLTFVGRGVQRSVLEMYSVMLTDGI